MARKPNHIPNKYHLPGLVGALIGSAMAKAIQADGEASETSDDLAGGASGAVLYKLSANNLDVGWSTGLLWDETAGLRVTGATNVTGYLNVGSAGPSPDPVAGHIVGIQVHDTGAFAPNVFFGQPVFGSSFGYAPTAFPAGTSYGFGIGSIAPADAGGTTGTVGSIFSAQITGSANAVSLTSNINLAVHAGTGTIGAGGVIAQRASARMTGAGDVTGGMIGLQADVRNSGGTPVSGFAAGIQVPSPTVSGSGSAFGTVYGVAILAQKVTGVTKGYGVNQVGTSDLNILAGATTIGAASDPTTSVTLDVKGTVIKTTPVTVASLPSASTVGAGARAFVSDALTPTFGATVTGGSTTATPVYSDGTNWKVG